MKKKQKTSLNTKLAKKLAYILLQSFNTSTKVKKSKKIYNRKDKSWKE